MVFRTKTKAYKSIDKLAIWEYNYADGETFKEIFGERSYEHIWDKFLHYNRSILALWGNLDLENRAKLSSYLKRKGIIK
jgi:hypothetical protein